MLTKLITSTVQRMGLTKFSPEIMQEIFPTAPQLNQPQIIDTHTREEYRHAHKIKHKRIPAQDLRNNWIRSHHNRIYTEK